MIGLAKEGNGTHARNLSDQCRAMIYMYISEPGLEQPGSKTEHALVLYPSDVDEAKVCVLQRHARVFCSGAVNEAKHRLFQSMTLPSSRLLSRC